MMGSFDPRTPIVRWTPLRKLELVQAIKRGKITEEDAAKLHALSQEELQIWRRNLDKGDASNLRVTKIERHTRQTA